MKIEEIINYFRASLPIVAIDSPVAEEQSMIEQICSQVGITLKMNVFSWNLAEGLKQVKYSTKHGISHEEVEDYLVESDPILDTLNYIEEHSGKAIFILVDLQYYLGSDPNRTDYAIIRKIKNLCFSLKRSYKRVILLGHRMNMSSEFDGLIHELSNDLPNQEIIHSVITECFEDLESNGYVINLDLNTSEGEKLVRSSQGLTIEEIRDAIRLSAVADEGITGTL